ncbi:dead end protein homolog 1-like [Anthonomus grandis grandis]|uniref:dead end protein homolog 1-like n=1 Tax=Anthonomus grandis grandis TaxID=2921223 RepID=UPI00216653D3|nr:dead end protein homolog 1-like [Anthonomus grandis grandis]
MSDLKIPAESQPTVARPIPKCIPKEMAANIHYISDEYTIIAEPSQTRAILTDRKQIPVPKRGSEVILLNIPRNITMRKIYDFMVYCGTIYEIRILLEFSGFNKGVCYVKFLNEHNATMAALVLDRCEIQPGVKLYIRKSFDNNRLKISNIPKDIPVSQISMDIFTGGGRGLADLKVEGDPAESNYQIVLEYDTHKDALLARRLIKNTLEHLSLRICIDWIEPASIKTVNSSTLYFKNFPEEQTRTDLFNFLCNIIDIDTVMKIHVKNGSGYIMFFECVFRKIAEKALQSARPSGRKLELRAKKDNTKSVTFPHPDWWDYQDDLLRSMNNEVENEDSFPVQPINEEHTNGHGFNVHDLMASNISIFNLPDIVTEPGILNEQFAINQAILHFIYKFYPHVNWTMLESDEEKYPNGQIVKLLLRVNGDNYAFVLAPRGNE